MSEIVHQPADDAPVVARPARVKLRNGNSFLGRAIVRDGAVIFLGKIEPVTPERGDVERTWPMHGDVIREIRWLDEAAA